MPGLAEIIAHAPPEEPLLFDPEGDNTQLLQRLGQLYERRRLIREFWRQEPLPVPVPITQLLPLDRERLRWFTLLLSESAEKRRQRKGGEAPKARAGLEALADYLVGKHPEASASGLWRAIPAVDWGDERIDFGEFEIYREGSKLVEIDHRSDRGGSQKRREASIGLRAWQRYVKKAREGS